MTITISSTQTAADSRMAIVSPLAAASRRLSGACGRRRLALFRSGLAITAQPPLPAAPGR